MTSRCVVVVGHVDHGKTALVGALTGMQTDRLEEEKRRGLSMVPGFAHIACGAGMLDFVDAPGHSDFIQSMIVGAAGAQAALIVVCGTQGIAQQTKEHLDIVRLLGIKEAVVAMTKSDLVSVQDLDTRRARISSTLANLGYPSAFVVPCSAKTGAGLEALKTALETFFDRPAQTSVPRASFLSVDRAFTRAGHGTIVTGTLLGKGLAAGDKLSLLPLGQSVALRGMQCRGAAQDRAQAGTRVALNLRDTAVAQVARGAVLCAPGSAASATCMEGHITLLPDTQRPLRHMDRLRVHLGTASQVAQVRLLGQRAIAAGQSAFAQLRFDAPAVGFAGQRAVLRQLSPPQTIGGAVVLDPNATLVRSGDKRRRALCQAALAGEMTAIVARLCDAGRGVAAVRDIARLARNTADEVKDQLAPDFVLFNAGFCAPVTAIKACEDQMTQALLIYHDAHPLRSFAPGKVIEQGGWATALVRCVAARMTAAGRLRQNAGHLALAAHDPRARLTPEQALRLAQLEAQLREAGLSSGPDQDTGATPDDADLIQLLRDTGAVVGLQNVALHKIVLLHADVIAQAVADLNMAFPPPTPFTTSAARSALGTSRRVIVPLLEHLDMRAITQRHGDQRLMNAPETVSPAHPPR